MLKKKPNPEIVKAYHLTTQDNWDKITIEGGLIPYAPPRHTRELFWFWHKIRFIWLWLDLPTGVDLIGSIIDRVVAHGNTTVSLIEVTIHKGNLLGIIGTHDGTLTHPNGNKFVYHLRKPFWAYLNPIPLSDTRVLKTWDFTQLVTISSKSSPIKLPNNSNTQSTKFKSPIKNRPAALAVSLSSNSKPKTLNTKSSK